MSRRLALLGATALLAGVVTAPVASAAAAASGGNASPAANPRPLPPHSQRAVCGPPVAKTARCDAHVVTYQDSATPLATSTYQSGWAPDDLAAAYNLPTLAGTPGSGPTVAIVDAFDNPNAESDLAAYRSQFGLGACTTANGCFKKVNQNGVQGSYPSGDTGWGAEIDLDIDMVSAACPACAILLVETTDNTFTNLMAGVDYAVGHAKFVSNSYGGPEFSSETSLDSHFNHPGIGITVSSGDSGYGVQWPAASRYVTAVGGTSLTKDATTTRGWSESVWSGAGSGCSALEQKPAWQHDTGCARRTVADVSAVANPNTGVAVYDSFGSSSGNWFVYGGTSVASPFVAGVWALGPAIVAPSAQIPYLHTAGWYDVTSGKNTNRCRSGYLCQAGVGYDGPTGLGTPTGASGFGGSVGSGGGGGGNTPPVAAFTSSCTGLSCGFTDQSTDADGTVTGWSWDFGDGSALSTTQNPTHVYAAGGSYTVTLTVTDNDGATNSIPHSVNVSSGGTGITLTASGHKVKGVDTVGLSWTGATSKVDIYRNNMSVVYKTVTGTSYTDNTGTKGGATFTYKVCNTGTTTCSSTVTVVF